MKLLSVKDPLEALYELFDNPEYIHPDPLEFVYRYPQDRDREVAGLVAACLAYGRVQTILKSVSDVLSPMGTSPYAFIISHTLEDFTGIYKGFTHRFTKGDEIAIFLETIRQTLLGFGSLIACFLSHDKPDAPSFQIPLAGFVTSLRRVVKVPPGSLLPDPKKRSAMKRLNLFLRWMVRKDRVDPGTWPGLSPERLIYPLDTHIHAFGLRFYLTRRRSADQKTAMEITDAFKTISASDPVKYDFALSHLGILGFNKLFINEP